MNTHTPQSHCPHHSDTPRITEIPAELGFLTNLKKLLIYKNELTELPEEIGHCASLEVSARWTQYVALHATTLLQLLLTLLYVTLTANITLCYTQC